MNKYISFKNVNKYTGINKTKITNLHPSCKQSTVTL